MEVKVTIYKDYNCKAIKEVFKTFLGGVVIVNLKNFEFETINICLN